MVSFFVLGARALRTIKGFVCMEPVETVFSIHKWGWLYVLLAQFKSGFVVKMNGERY
jgi:hypothetical protein